MEPQIQVDTSTKPTELCNEQRQQQPQNKIQVLTQPLSTQSSELHQQHNSQTRGIAVENGKQNQTEKQLNQELNITTEPANANPTEQQTQTEKVPEEVSTTATTQQTPLHNSNQKDANNGNNTENGAGNQYDNNPPVLKVENGTTSQETQPQQSTQQTHS